MRGHGITVVGAAIRQAVFRAVYTETNARIEINVMAIRAMVAIASEEGAAADATNSGQVIVHGLYGQCRRKEEL